MNEVSTYTSAACHWDKQWQHQEGRQDHLEPEPAVRELLPELQRRGARRALDLGCGIGRHALYLARAGLQVTALDLSPHGLEYTRRQAQERHLAIDCRLAPMHTLPLEDDSVDYVLSWNVIYHGTVDALAATVAEISRVLRPGGLFQATLLSKRNANWRVGTEIAPDTWVNEAGTEKAHPHCYRNALEVAQLLAWARMELWSLEDVTQHEPGSYHWHLIAEKHTA